MRKLRQYLAYVAMTFIAAMLMAGCGTPDEGLRGGAADSPATATPDASPVAELDEGGTLLPGSSPMMGSPAIQPTLAAEPGKPTFTEDDVRAWIAENPPSFWDTETPPPVVERVEFMPASETAAKVNHAVYQPDDALLCVATLSGTWAPDLPPGVKPSGSPIPNTVAYLIFDGTTGNLLGTTSGVEVPK